jgi:hypothetical protein
MSERARSHSVSKTAQNRGQILNACIEQKLVELPFKVNKNIKPKELHNDCCNPVSSQL